MQEFTDHLPLERSDSLTLQVLHEGALLFDIETTGFSSHHHIIYCIGCGYRTGDTITLKQYFAQSPEDELILLRAFVKLTGLFRTLISFNGKGFDLPFIQERCKYWKLKEHLDQLEQLDIFKCIQPLRKIFKLPGLKQKNIEQFLNLNREDTFSGGELISVFLDYQQDGDPEKLAMMRLHNREDILGMVWILPILAYSEFFNGHFTVEELELHGYQEYDGQQAQEAIFTLKPLQPLPKRISCGREGLYLSGYGTNVKLKVNLYQGELKFFYSNYKDYYYLPQEDIAIHKSVAFYVDKDFRTKAKAATCYSKKTGRFLPQYQEIITPYFKLEYHDKVSYVELIDEFIQDRKQLKAYAAHLFPVLLSSK